MQEETRKRVDAMTRQQQESRLAELNRRSLAHEVSRGRKPPEYNASKLIDEREELQYLKEKLGQDP